MSQQHKENHSLGPDHKDTLKSGASHFLVCGLGSLGQYCVAKLREFGVTVSAIVIVQPSIWQVPNLSDLLEDLVLGDCRQPEILTTAKIQQCRAVLIQPGAPLDGLLLAEVAYGYGMVPDSLPSFY